MSEDYELEQIHALDYTPIVRHRGKQFTIGDVSLSKIGGIDLHAAGVAAIPAVPTFVISAVLCAFIGKSMFLAVLPTFAVWVVFYMWFGRDVIDSQPPLARILMAISVYRNAPVMLSGTAPTVGKNSLGASILGSKHHAADEYPTSLHWVSIVKRASDLEHLADHTSIPDRAKYSPRPVGVSFAVDDDQHTYADWAEYLSRPTTQ